MGNAYDVIVVGARCAGAPTAMLLARKGLKVLLVDRASFPSEIPHGHFIHRGGPRVLRDWKLLERITKAGCPAVTTFTLDTGHARLVGRDLTADGVAFGYSPRRALLDKVLVEAAYEAGAEVRENFVVQGFTMNGARVTGIRGRGRATGAPVTTERASLIIGADGRSSSVAHAVGAPEYEVTPTLTCYFFSYWVDVASSGLEIYMRDRLMIFAFPTSGGAFAIFIAWPAEERRAVQADLERQFMAALDLVPDLAERVRAGARMERIYGAANLPNFLRKPYGPGWALVGDAGCHKDPYLALGICDAFRDAALLAEAVIDGLSGRRPLHEALASYEPRRNEATLADYEENIRLARLGPERGEQRALMAALQGDQEATNRFFMAREGMIPREAFFSAENLERIRAQVLPRCDRRAPDPRC